MKVLIPAKKESSRLSNKNWREFYKGKNLVEIKIEQVLKSFPASDVYLSSDYIEFKQKAEAYGIHFIHRHKDLASDNTPWPDAFAGIVNEMPVDDEEDIAWVEVINPLFDAYDLLFERWLEVKDQNDSLVLVSEFNKFLMNGAGMPLNFMYGKWHAMSQNKEKQYIWDSACIMKKKDMKYFSYPIGKTPHLFKMESSAIDIDTKDDFKLAQILFSQKYGHAN
ncbi:MAG: hypothetical protein R2852_08500 [Bacteroidia bacterium]